MIRNPYNYDTNAVSVETARSTPEPTLTQQEFVDECDINYQVSLYMRGALPPPPSNTGLVDLVESFDFQTAMDGIVLARETFQSMPSKIRDRFGNDPAHMMAFLADSENRYEAEKLGLIPATEVSDPSLRKAPMPSPVVDSDDPAQSPT